MKAIMISDKPKWCALTMNGKKHIEVRKNKALASAIQKLIDEYGYAEFYVYCSLAKHIKDYLQIENGKYVCSVPKDYEKILNGKIKFKFRCYKVEEIKLNLGARLFTKTFNEEELLKNACLTTNEIEDYLFSNAMQGYAIHISDLEIFDKPKEISEFYKVGANAYQKDIEQVYGERAKRYTDCFFQLTKAPQNFCYVEVDE